MVTPGDLIRAMRARHGLSQKRLAVRAGTTQSAISRIERGHVSPTVETLRELAFVMGEELALEPKPLDWGHDLDLLRANMDLTPAQRVDQNAAMASFVREARAGIDRPKR